MSQLVINRTGVCVIKDIIFLLFYNLMISVIKVISIAKSAGQIHQIFNIYPRYLSPPSVLSRTIAGTLAANGIQIKKKKKASTRYFASLLITYRIHVALHRVASRAGKWRASRTNRLIEQSRAPIPRRRVITIPVPMPLRNVDRSRPS